MSSNASTNQGQKKGIWTKFMQALVGSQQTSPLGRYQTHPGSVVPEPSFKPDLRPEASRGRRPRTQVVYDALAEAAADFEYNEVRPLRELVPGTTFHLEQIRTQCGPDALALLGDVINLRRAHRNKAVVSKIGNLGFDLSGFADWRIEALEGESNVSDPAAEGEILTVIAGDGPFRAKLHFQFYGTFDEAAPESSPQDPTPETDNTKPKPPVHYMEQVQSNPVEEAPMHVAVPRPSPAGVAAQTMVVTPPRRGQNAATLLDVGVATPKVRTALARLRLTTEDGQEQVVDITTLPFEIGREPTMDSACTVPEAAARVSRVHLRLEKLQGGSFVVNNLGFNRSGTWCNGEKLDARFTLTPVSVHSKGGWHILGERNLSATSVALRLEVFA